MQARYGGGFSLLETLIAVVVLAAGLLGVATLQTLSTQVNHGAVLNTQAALAAIAIVERMRANPDQALAGAYDAAPGSFPVDCEIAANSCTPAQLAAFDLVRWRARIAATLPGGGATISTNSAVIPARVTITVQWDHSKGQSAAVSEQVVMNL